MWGQSLSHRLPSVAGERRAPSALLGQGHSTLGLSLLGQRADEGFRRVQGVTSQVPSPAPTASSENNACPTRPTGCQGCFCLPPRKANGFSANVSKTTEMWVSMSPYFYCHAEGFLPSTGSKGCQAVPAGSAAWSTVRY